MGYIYFAVYAADTGHKARKRGVLLKARVNFGRIKTVEHGREVGVNAAEGYESDKLTRRYRALRVRHELRHEC